MKKTVNTKEATPSNFYCGIEGVEKYWLTAGINFEKNKHYICFNYFISGEKHKVEIPDDHLYVIQWKKHKDKWLWNIDKYLHERFTD